MTPRRTRFAPGTPEYWALDSFQRHAIVLDHLEDVRGADEPDIQLEADLRGLEMHERAECALADPIWDITHHCYIRDKGGRKVLFHPWKNQLQLLEKFEAARRENRPGRFILAKARRYGGTAVTAEYIYTRVTREEGKYALIVAHERSSAEEIFAKLYRFAYNHDTFPLRPEKKHKTRRELVFDDIDGQIIVSPVGEDVGRGFGFHYIHLSEAAFYEDKGHNVYTMVSSFLQTMPSINDAWTLLVVESTGNGTGNFFASEAIRAYRGESPYELVFVPWFHREDAHLPFDDGAAKVRFEKSLDEEERLLLAKFDLSLEQLHWRRWEWENEIKAPTRREKRRLFLQELPSEFMDCFQSADKQVFDGETIGHLRKNPRCAPPRWTGELKAPLAMWDPKERRARRETPIPRFRPRDDGELFVWKKPRDGHRYAMGVDLAEGTERGDWTVMYVIDRDTRETVAVHRSKKRHYEVLDDCRLLSKWYNDSWICPETNRFKTFIEDLQDSDRVDFLYFRRAARDQIGQEFQEVFGQRTSDEAKGNYVALVEEAMDREPGFFVYEDLLDELSIFQARVSEATGRTLFIGAVGDGKHDDIVIAFSLALQCDRDMPKLGPAPGETLDEGDDPKAGLLGNRIRAQALAAERARGSANDRYAMMEDSL